jgi:signal transduction histidine kinase
MKEQFSLERRLIGRLSPILAGSFLLFAVVYLFFIQNDATFHAAEEVGELARNLATTIHTAPDGSPAFSQAEVRALAKWGSGTSFAAIDLATGKPVAGSAPRLLADLRGRPDVQRSGGEIIDTPNGMDVLAIERMAVGGAQYRIGVLRPMTLKTIAMIGLTHEFAEEILPCFLPALVLAVFVTWFTIRRNLRPLRLASAEASAVSVERPGQRVSTVGMATEIRPLIDAVNRALTRLEGAIAAQRRFTANAAHELRTPLAVLRARVDGLEPGPDRAVLTRDIVRMSRAVSQMLLTARLQAGGLDETASVNLAALTRDVIADMAPLAHSKGRDITLEISARPIVAGSSTALESAVRNLIENALRFTPDGKSVTVRVLPGATIAVEDCGPGITDADKTRIFEPFWRAQAPSGDGAGLGLAIVNEVAALHGGDISVQDVPGGGARFVLQLRGAPDTQGINDLLATRGQQVARPRLDDAPHMPKINAAGLQA